MKRLLFLCTGNYYRSRYAELMFNILAPAGLGWQADSRGLNITAGINEGPLSPFVTQRLQRRGIALTTPRFPLPAHAPDFPAASLVIALKRTEHRPLMEAHFPAWADRIDYWQVDDIDLAPPDSALGLIDAQLEQLLSQLAQP